MDVSKNRGTPKWMVYNGSNPIKMDDLGGSIIFGNTHIHMIYKQDFLNLYQKNPRTGSGMFLFFVVVLNVWSLQILPKASPCDTGIGFGHELPFNSSHAGRGEKGKAMVEQTLGVKIPW